MCFIIKMRTTGMHVRLQLFDQHSFQWCKNCVGLKFFFIYLLCCIIFDNSEMNLKCFKCLTVFPAPLLTLPKSVKERSWKRDKLDICLEWALLNKHIKAVSDVCSLSQGSLTPKQSTTFMTTFSRVQWCRPKLARKVTVTHGFRTWKGLFFLIGYVKKRLIWILQDRIWQLYCFLDTRCFSKSRKDAQQLPFLENHIIRSR